MKRAFYFCRLLLTEAAVFALVEVAILMTVIYVLLKKLNC